MKKFLAILLTACMIFSISALAAETTFAEPFTILDFGSDSRLDDMWKANLISAYKTQYCVVEENEDSWTITVTTLEEGYHDLKTSEWAKIGPQTPFFAIFNISQLTYGFKLVNNGWGGYEANGYSTSTGEWKYALDAQWQGKNQFMKIRLKNLTDNTRMCIYPDASMVAFTPMYSIIFDVEANDTEFQTYVVDMIKAEIRSFYGGDYNKYFTPPYSSLPDFRWGAWSQKETTGMKFWFFGAYGEYAKEEDITFRNIQLGDTVEVDYIIFAATADMAAEYKSIDEGYVPEETTTTEKVETTTTAKVETTTTTQKVEETTTTTAKVEETTTTTEAVVDETTTTEAIVDETTTTEAVVDETTTTEAIVDETTTTEAVVDETTTTTVSDGTTTTANGGNNQKDGGFPVWIIIVIVVVIGGGVAAFFVFKK